ASGDKFISSSEELAKIKKDFPDLKCVEMEGAAVAQVCYEHNVPLTVVRVISDKADSDAKINFPLFISKVASQYSRGIICNLLDRI
ncbi:MAG: 5'-methylthioadenosine/adenosylhomocysteine nucleosidase, partial [Planctomycetes bacterium]|nr:5'-methylthioadenosine/adenosylhomocysteine nucleosidase [Planctomycetota bacterium]